MSSQLTQTHDRWLLPLGGREVTQCQIDYAITYVFGDPAGSFYVTIERPFSLRIPGGEERMVDPEGDPDQVGPALRVLRRALDEATAFKDGRLELMFDDGTAVSVPVSKRLEPWNIVGPAGLRVVSLPGGDTPHLARPEPVDPARAKRHAIRAG